MVQPTSTRFAAFWPSINNESDANKVLRYSAYVAWWVSASSALALVLAFYFETTLTGPDDYAAGYSETIDVAAMILSAWLGWLVYSRHVGWPTYIILAWVAIEIVAKIAYTPGKGLVVSAFLALYAIQGVRAHRFLSGLAGGGKAPPAQN